MSATNRVLYIGTDNGLVRVRPRGGEGYTIEPWGLGGLVVMGVIVDSEASERIYAATRNDGMYRSDDGGETWKEVNKGILYKEIWSLAQHPRTGELFVGTQPPAVFKSVDRGESFFNCASLQQLEDSLHWTFPRPPHIAHIKHITVALEEPSLVYGAVEEGWVLRSVDGGRTWETLKQGAPFDAHGVTVLPGRPTEIVVTSGAGVFRSDNGGDKFVRSDRGITRGPLGGGYMSAAAVHPLRPEVLYVAGAELPPPFWQTRAQGANTFFYRSEDRGLSWQILPCDGIALPMRAGPRACVIDPEDPYTVFFGMSDGSVWMTENGGESFRAVAEGLPGWIAGICVARMAPLSGARRSIPPSVRGGEVQVGEIYEITISNEIDSPFMGLYGLSRLGDCDVRIPHGKRGERYKVRLLSIGINSFTGRKEATIQKLAGPE